MKLLSSVLLAFAMTLADSLHVSWGRFLGRTQLARIGILGDVHSNIEALEAVLSSFVRDKVERVYAVGDLVGYGADPSAVLARIRSENIRSVWATTTRPWWGAG